jgi:6-pyruvoyltetrahydropterin/6-carboxytetrahydropterin synthase
MPKYQSTKTYGNDRGLSCCFRQWKANHSHCSTLHGYSLGFKFVFESETLDEKNWCFDFGGMKPIKEYLDHMFDHTVLVAEDDPAKEFLLGLAGFSTKPEFIGKAPNPENKPFEEGRVCNLRIVPGVGCELTAKLVYDKACEILEKMKTGELGRYAVNSDVRLVSVECFEHAGNSAIYFGEPKIETSNPLAMVEDYFFANEKHRIFKIEADLTVEQVQEYIEKVKAEAQQQKLVTVQKVIDQIELLIESDSDISDILYFTNKLIRQAKIPPSV